jgi:hypothetical protein
MCRTCDAGWPLDKVLQLYCSRIRRDGWAAVHVAPTPQLAEFSYTAGLTRLHGHPEVVVSGAPPELAARILAAMAQAARAGHRLEAGMVLPGTHAGQFQFVQVDDPGRLAHAQHIYQATAGPIPALQVIWSDRQGHWPWSPGWPTSATAQPLFGTPLHT